MIRTPRPPTFLVMPILFAIGASCGPSAPKPLEFRPVAAENAQRLEAAIGSEPPLAKADPELVDRARELVGQVASQKGDVRLSFAAQSKPLGDAIVPVLSGWIGNLDWGWIDRTAAIELLAGLDSPRAAAALEYHARKNPETRVRSYCAWYLGETQQDQCMIGLLQAWRDESDADVRRSIGQALAKFGCHAHVDPAGRHDSDAMRMWRYGDPEGKLPTHEPSARLQLEVWRTIGVLGDLPSFAAGMLAIALRDTNADVRRGAARALAGMEMRGSAAGAALHESLQRDPAVMLEAVEALGAVHHEPAADDILSFLGAEHPLDLRIAAARALGKLAVGRTLAGVQAAMQPGQPAALRTTAAIALLPFGRDKEAFPVLDETMSSSVTDVSAVETAIETWLQTRAFRNDERAQKWMQQWVGPSATRATRTKLLHDEILPSL